MHRAGLAEALTKQLSSDNSKFAAKNQLRLESIYKRVCTSSAGALSYVRKVAIVVTAESHTSDVL